MLTRCRIGVGHREALDMECLAFLGLTDEQISAETAQRNCKRVNNDSDHELLFQRLLQEQEVLLADELLQFLIALQQSLHLRRP